ncbi:MAG: ROK family protein [Ruminococcaceae bacterium]|nr:ROK family protein [Oscillospiraceae bacterium]
MTICIDMGATEIKVAPIERKNNEAIVGKTEKFPTNAHLGRDGIVSALKSAIASLYSEQADGVAIASAGDIDISTSKITYATENLPGMIGFDFAQFCKQEFALNAKAINDAHAALLGEMAFGAGKKHRDKRVAMLTLGSGVGGGYYKDGKIAADETNDYARFGHIALIPGGRECTCGKLGCIEMYLSGRAIHKDAAAIGIDGPDIFEKYAMGVEKNLEFAAQFRRNLKDALDKVYKVSPFDVCIIGGGVADWMGDSFFPIMNNLGYDIIRASLGNSAGMFGAYAHYNNFKYENEDY